MDRRDRDRARRQDARGGRQQWRDLVLGHSTGREIEKVSADDGWTNVIAGSADGTRLAWSGTDGAIYVWDVKQRKTVATLPGFKSVISARVFSRDGTKPIEGDYNGKLRVHEIATKAATELALAK